MGTPYNDQWVLRRARRGRSRRHGHASARHAGSSELAHTASRDPSPVPGPASPAAARALSDAMWAIGRLGKRPKWIDRDT
jgi:hypothetical protein